MKITIVGTGYVGLVTGTCFAEMGNEVVCLDLDAEKIRILNDGGIPIFEAGLHDLVQKNLAAGRLRFTTNVEEAVEHGFLQFIAVGTPPEKSGAASLEYVFSAAHNVGQHMNSHKIVVTKSTVPVGTTDKVKSAVMEELRKRGLSIRCSVVSNPEFLKEGAAVEDFMRPNRIVIGADDEDAIHAMRALYAPFQRNHERMLVMDIRSAELTKYAANAMLATRISFMNELANLAESLGADIESVRQGIGSDMRIGPSFLYAGCGYGGSCFPKDVRALSITAKENGHELKILGAVDAVNEEQKGVLFQKITKRFSGNLRGKHIAIWGLAFKPSTDDMREAPSRVLISKLLAAGATVCAYDPVAMPEARRIFANQNGISFSERIHQACEGADALAIVTEWREFRSPDFEAIKKALRYPVIFDGRNLFDPRLLSELGFEYQAIGRVTPRQEIKS